MSKELNTYIQSALEKGSDKSNIEDTLVEAGWAPEVVRKTMVQYAGVDSHGVIIPAPRFGIHHIIRDIFVYLLIFITLSMASYALGSLLFNLIDYFFPDAVVNTYHHNTSWAIAQLVVTSPVYLWLSLWLGKDVSMYPQKRESLVRKMLIYFILLITAVIGIGDLIFVITKFLDGELSTRFLLQSMTVVGISSSVFSYYLFEMRRDDLLTKNNC